jgi:hypothetical protein
MARYQNGSVRIELRKNGRRGCIGFRSRVPTVSVLNTQVLSVL